MFGKRSALPKRAAMRNGMDALARLQMDDLARAVVMVRAGAHYELGATGLQWFGPCECCKRDGWLQWSHIYGRGEAPRLVWVPENAMAQTAACHYRWTRHPMSRVETMLAVFARRTPCDFAATPDLYRARLLGLKRAKGKVDHAAQRVANLAALPRPVRDDLEWLWGQRAAVDRGGSRG